MHFVMAAVLSLLVHQAFIPLFDRVERAETRIGVFNPVLMVLAVGCIADELMQAYFPTRNFHLLDMAASLAGLLAGFVVYLCIYEIHKRREC